jgi:hypothetical protein
VNTQKTGLSVSGRAFEDLKRINDHGAKFRSARDLQSLPGYSQWRRFEQAIERAITFCKQSGNPPENHFVGVGKMVDIGSGSSRTVDDYHLSRFACYLIARNGDPRKPEIARAQKYFAIQTRRQELSDQAAADRERLELRRQTSEEFKALLVDVGKRKNRMPKGTIQSWVLRGESGKSAARSRKRATCRRITDAGRKSVIAKSSVNWKENAVSYGTSCSPARTRAMPGAMNASASWKRGFGSGWRNGLYEWKLA